MPQLECSQAYGNFFQGRVGLCLSLRNHKAKRGRGDVGGVRGSKALVISMTGSCGRSPRLHVALASITIAP